MNINRADFGKICKDVWERIEKLNRTKGEEYTGSEGAGNVHANFDRLSAKLKISPDKVLWVYLTKHLDSIENHINEADQPTQRALSEPMEGRVDDAILYLLLWRAMNLRRNYRDSGMGMVGGESAKQARADSDASNSIGAAAMVAGAGLVLSPQRWFDK